MNVINVEDHAVHCRMARENIYIYTIATTAPFSELLVQTTYDRCIPTRGRVGVGSRGVESPVKHHTYQVSNTSKYQHKFLRLDSKHVRVRVVSVQHSSPRFTNLGGGCLRRDLLSPI